MNFTSNLKLSIVLLLVAKAGEASPGPDVTARQLLVEQFPGSLDVEESRGQLEFCPDNTCIAVRSADAQANLEGWLLAYLFHFGDYYALSDWRARVGSPAGIEGYPAELEGCLAKTEAAKCQRQAFADARIDVLDVTYDEGHVSEMEALFNPHEAVRSGKP